MSLRYTFDGITPDSEPNTVYRIVIIAPTAHEWRDMLHHGLLYKVGRQTLRSELFSIVTKSAARSEKVLNAAPDVIIYHKAKRPLNASDGEYREMSRIE